MRVVSRPVKTLQQEFPAKSRPPTELQPNVVYKLVWPTISFPEPTCLLVGADQKTRGLWVRDCVADSPVQLCRRDWQMLKQKKRTRLAKRVPTSLNTLGLQITLLTEYSQVIDKGSFRTRKTLGSWHTASENHADNSSRPLPNQYYHLIILFLQSRLFLYVFVAVIFYIFIHRRLV